jgi:hypothetical protein
MNVSYRWIACSIGATPRGSRRTRWLRAISDLAASRENAGEPQRLQGVVNIAATSSRPAPDR